MAVTSLAEKTGDSRHASPEFILVKAKEFALDNLDYRISCIILAKSDDEGMVDMEMYTAGMTDEQRSQLLIAASKY